MNTTPHTVDGAKNDGPTTGYVITPSNLSLFYVFSYSFVIKVFGIPMFSKP